MPLVSVLHDAEHFDPFFANACIACAQQLLGAQVRTALRMQASQVALFVDSCVLFVALSLLRHTVENNQAFSHKAH